MKAFPQILKAFIFSHAHDVDSHCLVHRFYTTRTASRTRPSSIGTKRDPSPKGGNTSSRALRRSSRHDIPSVLFGTFSHADNCSSFKNKTATKMTSDGVRFIIAPPLRNCVPTTFRELHSVVYSPLFSQSMTYQAPIQGDNFPRP